MSELTRRDLLKTTGAVAAGAALGLGLGEAPPESQAQTAGGGGGKQSAGSVLSLPKGGGAVKGIGETFSPNPFTGTANFTVPIATSPGRSGFGPEISLQYSSGNGNGPFGLGWALSVPQISLKTERGIPQYQGKDTYLLSGAEDLVLHDQFPPVETEQKDYLITTYRPRVEGLFARIQHWKKLGSPTTEGDQLSPEFWRITTKDNITNLYGRTSQALLHHPDDPSRIYQWFLQLTFDTKGNYLHYEYLPDNATDLPNKPYEEHRRKDQARRGKNPRTWQVYLKRIRYGNVVPLASFDQQTVDARLADIEQKAKDPTQHFKEHFFEVVFDYGEHGKRDPIPVSDEEKKDCLHGEAEGPAHQEITADIYVAKPSIPYRCDPFSSYRAGFEIRTYRRCQRVLMFHNAIPRESGPVLVKSTDFQYQADPYTKVSCLKSVTQRGYRKVPPPHSPETETWYESEEFSVPGEKVPGVRSRHYHIGSFPPVDFGYTSFTPNNQKFQPFEAVGGDLPPRSLADPTFALVDVYGTGLPDVLHTMPNAYYVWRNLGNGQFDMRRPLKDQPAGITLDQEGVGFGDMAGDGRADLLVHQGPKWHFYEATHRGGWKKAHFYKQQPSFSLSDPNVKMVDLTGDGKSDVLRADDSHFTYFPCLGEEGFGKHKIFRRRHKLEDFPDVFFSDPRVRLVDLSGDGLTDIALVHSGRVDYWPNLGHGEWGARVTMQNTPHFGANFDPRRLLFADIDGSGPVDMVYVESGQVKFWLNQSGNAWSQEQVIYGTPQVTDLDSLEVADMFGSGTSGILYSTDYRGLGRSNYWYLDLTGGSKPYVLTEMTNNLGATTRAEYSTSTQEYLDDLQIQRPWITTLPFPVKVLKKVEVIDHIGKSKLVTTYRYHHGYYDGREREFRGFGRVDQTDSEIFKNFSSSTLHEKQEALANVNEAFHVPPIHTKTWFHTGLFYEEDITTPLGNTFNAEHLLEYYREEYYDKDPLAFQFPSHEALEPGVGATVPALHLAYRALRGSVLRTEVYAQDGSDKAEHPYTVTESRFHVRKLQDPKPLDDQSSQDPVFFPFKKETLTYHYERNPADPRIGHELTLEIDGFGNVLKSAAIAYGRRKPDASLPLPEDRDQQTKSIFTYTEKGFTNTIYEPDAYRTPLPCESRTYELTGYSPSQSSGLFRDEDFVQPVSKTIRTVALIKDGEVPYEQEAGTGRMCRLIEQARTLYRPDNLELDPTDRSMRLLPLGTVESRALPGESFQLALTPGLLTKVFQRTETGQAPQGLLPDPDLVLGGRGGDQGGYRSSQQLKNQKVFPTDSSQPFWSLSDTAGHWWVPSGQVFYSPQTKDTAAQELAFAQRHFFLPHRFRDPFHTSDQPIESSVEYDKFQLLPVASQDALTNTVKAENDYRVLQSTQLTDPNRNRTAVAIDTRGMVTATAVMGKEGERLGDLLEGFPLDPSMDQIQQFAKDPLIESRELLGKATSRMVYDLWRYWREGQPPFVSALARETHVHEPGGATTNIQVSFAFSDGLGREVQKKIQAEQGPVPRRDTNGKIIVGADGHPQMTTKSVSPRWVGSGWTVFNNKGKPVRQYEPFFTDRHHFEFDVRIGVSPVLFYDPVERVVATLHPNHTYEKIMFDPWQQTTYDVNDTCAPRNQQTGDPRTDQDIAGYVGTYLAAQPTPWQTWFAQRRTGEKGVQEQNAAQKAEAHADTPATAHVDVLGRPFLTVACNRVVCAGHVLDGTEEHVYTRLDLDVQGNQRSVRDERQLPVQYLPTGSLEQRIVMRYAYDLLGTRIHQFSMEAGERWMLNDISGQPIHSWDSRGHHFSTKYDVLRRPVGQTVRGTSSASDPRTLNREILVDKIEYGESLLREKAEALNLLTRLYRHFDSAGVATNARLAEQDQPTAAYDFKGNLLHSTRRLISDYKNIPNWQEAPPFELEAFEGSTRYDALNRPSQSIAPHSSLTRAGHPNTLNVIQPVFNEANLLERIDVWLERPGEPTSLLHSQTEPPSPVGVANINYDAKGQRQRIDYKNGATTFYHYDPATFRLTHLYTRRGEGFTEDCDNVNPPPSIIVAADYPPPKGKACGVQNLLYTYDPAGNITHIQDDAQQKIYFKNKCVKPSNDYTYDALYRLIQGTGREHLGQLASGERQPPTAPDGFNAFHTNLAHPGDCQAMGTYIERYVYDAVGNFLQMQHRGTDPTHPGWTRVYDYMEMSVLEDGNEGRPAKLSNRLTRTRLNPDNHTPLPEHYGHDIHGNMIHMPHLQAGPAGTHPQNMFWDYNDQLRQIELGGGGTAYYIYDATRQRVRKVWEKAPGRTEERIYLGAFEIYRKRNGPVGTETANLERETLHVMDDKQRIALVETRTLNTAANDQAPRQLIRYQLGNHLGSVSLELDNHAKIISYEEYAPYGSSTYQAVRSQTETAKRYRYTGKERDEESGLYYHGARYYAPWLGKWTSCDPVGILDGNNLYRYVKNNPVIFTDSLGLQSEVNNQEVTHIPDGPSTDPDAPATLGPENVLDRGSSEQQSNQSYDDPSTEPDIPATLGTESIKDRQSFMGPSLWEVPPAEKEKRRLREMVSFDLPPGETDLKFGDDFMGYAYYSFVYFLKQGIKGTYVRITEPYEPMYYVNEGRIEEDNGPRDRSASFMAVISVVLMFEGIFRPNPKSLGLSSGIISKEPVLIRGSGGPPRIPPNRVSVPLPNQGESYLQYGTRVHQEFPRIVELTNPQARGVYNVAPGLTGPDLSRPLGMNANFAEMKSIWGRQSSMVSQAKKWGFDAQSGRYFFYDRNTGHVFEGIIQTEKYFSGRFKMPK